MLPHLYFPLVIDIETFWSDDPSRDAIVHLPDQKGIVTFVPVLPAQDLCFQCFRAEAFSLSVTMVPMDSKIRRRTDNPCQSLSRSFFTERLGPDGLAAEFRAVETTESAAGRRILMAHDKSTPMHHSLERRLILLFYNPRLRWEKSQFAAGY